MLTRGATVPGLQGVCWVLPVGAKWPTMVSVHPLRLVRLVALEYEPSTHGSAAPAPSRQYEPGSQATHLSSPSSAWYLPAAHLSHAPWPAMGWTVPGLHLVCSVLPVGAKLPLSDGVHSLGPVRLVEIEYEPSAHGSGALAPAGQNEPGLQATHACSPSSAWYVPAAHLSQVPCFATGWTVPGLHLVGGLRIRAFLARQRRAGARWAVRARLAGNARLLALLGLVCTGCALVARALACVGLNGAGAALGLLDATRRREASLVGRRALSGAGEVGGDRIRALRARQRRAGTLWAVRAGLAGNARLLALVGLVRACRALVAGALLCDGLDGPGSALGLLGTARRREVALVRRRALRCAGAHWAVRAGLARLTLRLLPLVLKRAFSARRADTHPCVSCECAGATGLRRDAARGRVEARPGRVALRGAAEVGTTRVRALLARQRRARAKRAEVPRLAGDAHLLALAGLVLAGFAPVARALACVGLDGARATPGLLRAARRCIVARISCRALVGAAEVGPIRVRALAARQWRRRALSAVRARHAHVALGPAGYVHKLACAALVACGLLVQWLHGTRAAWRRVGAARGCVEARRSGRATASGAEVGLIGVRARRARQHDAGTLGAVRARLASSTCLLALVGLVRTSCAPVARTLACVGLDGAGAALSRLDAASWRVGSWRCIFATISTAEAGEVAPRATGARYTPHAPRLAVVALLACGRSDSGRCSAHVTGRAEGRAQTAGLLHDIVAVAVHSSCTCTRVVLVVPALPESDRGSAPIICCLEAVPNQMSIVA
eukprot:scaffold7455_cov72-Phaeocystis_antarctica.AAC.2